MEMAKHKLCSRHSQCGQEASTFPQDVSPDHGGLLLRTGQHSPQGTHLGTGQGRLVTSCLSSNRPPRQAVILEGSNDMTHVTANTTL